MSRRLVTAMSAATLRHVWSCVLAIGRHLLAPSRLVPAAVLRHTMPSAFDATAGCEFVDDLIRHPE
jgi:hypothetical protein